MAKILIKNGRVWDGERFFYADVLTDGGAIAEIGEGITAPATFTYDASGAIVSAGLVDAHVHLRGISCEKFGTQAEMSSFPFGVTAAADASGERGDVSRLEAMMLKSVVFAKVEFCSNRADFTKTEETLARFSERAVGIKVYFDTTMSDIRNAAPLREACDFAHARGLRVMVHCAHAPTPMTEILDALGKGDILTHSFHGGENNAAEDGFASMRAAQARGVVIDVGFAGHVHTDFAVLGDALRSGITPDVISTDITRLSAFTRGGRYGMTMCMSMARALGMRQEDIFRAVTAAPAAALGKGNAWGRLSVGGSADLAVFDPDANEPFDLLDKAGNRLSGARGYRCLLTVADGEVVYRY